MLTPWYHREVSVSESCPYSKQSSDYVKGKKVNPGKFKLGNLEMFAFVQRFFTGE